MDDAAAPATKTFPQQLDDGTNKALDKIVQKFTVGKMKRCFPSLNAQQLDEAHRILHSTMRSKFLQEYSRCKTEMNVDDRLMELWQYVTDASAEGDENKQPQYPSNPMDLARQLMYGKKREQLDQLQAEYRKQMTELESLKDQYFEQTAELKAINERTQSLASHSLDSAVERLGKITSI